MVTTRSPIGCNLARPLSVWFPAPPFSDSSVASFHASPPQLPASSLPPFPILLFPRPHGVPEVATWRGGYHCSTPLHLYLSPPFQSLPPQRPASVLPLSPAPLLPQTAWCPRGCRPARWYLSTKRCRPQERPGRHSTCTSEYGNEI